MNQKAKTSWPTWELHAKTAFVQSLTRGLQTESPKFINVIGIRESSRAAVKQVLQHCSLYLALRCRLQILNLPLSRELKEHPPRLCSLSSSLSSLLTPNQLYLTLLLFFHILFAHNHCWGPNSYPFQLYLVNLNLWWNILPVRWPFNTLSMYPLPAASTCDIWICSANTSSILESLEIQ